MRNGACTPWQMARFNAVRAYDHSRLRNEKLGIGNSHMMDPMEFALLMNDSKSNFDPYEYMEEMEEKISHHCSDYDFPIAAAPVALSDDDSQDHKSSHRRELKMMNNCAWSPWQRARFSAVRAYDHLRLENEKLGVGNSHMMDPMEFALLINKSDASFDPYKYMEEMQERITPDERAKKSAKNKKKRDKKKMKKKMLKEAEPAAAASFP